jgi:hypothetical protein
MNLGDELLRFDACSFHAALKFEPQFGSASDKWLSLRAHHSMSLRMQAA